MRLRLWYLSAVFGALFILTGWLAGTGHLAGFDQAGLQAMSDSRSSVATGFFEFITRLASPLTMPIYAVLLAGLLFRRKSHVLGWFAILVIAGSALLNGALKLLYERARPDLAQPLLPAAGFSFPSGHAMASMTLAGLIVYLCWRRSWRRISLAVGMIYVLLIGLSRVYLGVHYPSDIIGGWLASLTWLVLAIIAYRWLRSHSQSSP